MVRGFGVAFFYFYFYFYFIIIMVMIMILRGGWLLDGDGIGRGKN